MSETEKKAVYNPKEVEDSYYKLCEERGYFEIDGNKSIQEAAMWSTHAKAQKASKALIKNFPQNIPDYICSGLYKMLKCLVI